MLKKNYDIVLTAVNQNGYDALKHADESLKKNYDIVMVAVKQNEWSNQQRESIENIFVSNSRWNDKTSLYF